MVEVTLADSIQAWGIVLIGIVAFPVGRVRWCTWLKTDRKLGFGTARKEIGGVIFTLPVTRK